MKITKVETLRLGEFPNLLHVRLHTDEGLIGLGETSFGPRAAEAYIHESAAPYLLGKDPCTVEAHAEALAAGYVGFAGTGAEMRGRSAVDIALWDLWGQATGQSIHQLLGGACRDSIRAYNTCAGYRYVRATSEGGGLTTDAWGLTQDAEGPYEDLDAFLTRPVELAKSLLDMGIDGMKIWPFDPFAEKTRGHGISNADLARGLEPFQAIRDALGDRMDLMVEMHSLWDVPTAIRIARALEDIAPAWIEDPIRMDAPDMLARVSDATTIPITASEMVATRWGHRDLIARGKPSIVMFEPVWVGGITESRQIIGMAQASHLPVAVHDCLGPVEYAVALHLSMFAPNAIIQESVRAFWSGWYRELATVVPPVVDGLVTAPTGPGLGTELRPEVFERPDLMRQTTAS
ncbi:MAG: galactonate dehydratase [Glaciecola sp.]|jgi:galactonate dehydratase